MTAQNIRTVDSVANKILRRCHACLLPQGNTRYPLYRRLGGAPVPVWTGSGNIAYNGIRSPDCPQPVASRYTDWGTRPTGVIWLHKTSELYTKWLIKFSEGVTPARYPKEVLGTHCTGDWVGPQCRSGQVREISHTTEFDPRTVQPVASRYTDWATRPTGAIWLHKTSGLYTKWLIKFSEGVTPACYPKEILGTHCTGDWVGPQFRSGQVREISHTTEFDPRTVQPVASRYTDWATRPQVT